MSRMITRSLSMINLKRPTQDNQPKPVAKNFKTSTTLKTKSVKKKIAVTSQVKQANDVSMRLMKPRISLGPFGLESTKSFTNCHSTSKPVLKVLPMRRQTTESGFQKKPIPSRRETLSTTTLNTTTPVRRSERISLNQSTPIYYPPRKSRYQKPAVHSLPIDIQKVNENSKRTSTTNISKRRYTQPASNERKEPTEAQPKTAAKRKLEVPITVRSSSVKNLRVNENLPSTTTISKRRYTLRSNERREPTKAQPNTPAKRKLAVPNAFPSSSVENQRVNENLPSTTTISKRRYTLRSNERKEPTKVQPNTPAKRQLAVPNAFRSSSVENQRVNENLPSTTTISKRRYTLRSNQGKEPTEAQPKTPAKRKLAVPIVVHSSSVENPRVNDLPSTTATKIPNRRSTHSSWNKPKEPIESQPKTSNKRKLETPIADHPSPVEITIVNESLPSTSATKISNEHKKPTDGKPKTATKRKLEAPNAVGPSPVEIPQVDENLPSTSATNISNLRNSRLFSNKPTKPVLSTTDSSSPVPKEATDQISAVDTSQVEIQKESENLPSTSMMTISRQRITQVSKQFKEPSTFSPSIHSTLIEISKNPANQMSANHPSPNEIPKRTEDLPSTSGTKVLKRLSTKAARKSAGPSVLGEIPNGKAMANEGKIEIIIPSELKRLLLNDVNIIREGKRYKMPATQSVAKIIQLYVELKKPTERKDENHFGFTYKQIFDNVLEYFDTLIGEQLLYESERILYLHMLNNFPGEKMSTLYPPIYLLRLFVKLNSLLQFSCTDKDTLQYVVNYVNEFAKYLAENKSIFSDMNIFC